MVLESLISPYKAKAHPNVLFIHGLIYSSIALFLSMWIFNEHASLIMVFLTSMAAIPLIYNIIKMEEKKDLTELTEKNLLREHTRALSVFLYYFLGVTLGFGFWYIVLPSSTISGLFEVQTQTIADIGSNVTGNSYQSFRKFTQILSNNFNVSLNKLLTFGYSFFLFGRIKYFCCNENI